MSPAVFDTSALLALIFGEPGASMAESYLDNAIISAVNLTEAATKALDRGTGIDLFEQELAALGLVVVPYEVAHAIEAARLRSFTRRQGLSLGDRACLALAGMTGRAALTADTAWTKTGLPFDIRLIR